MPSSIQLRTVAIYQVPRNIAKKRFGIRQPNCRLSKQPARLNISLASTNQPWRSQPCSATCSFKRAMAIATRTASCRSSPGSSLRSLTSPRIRSRASMNSLSSLACSAHLIASLVAEHIPHLLKTATRKLPSRRIKSKHYFSLFVRPKPCTSKIPSRPSSPANPPPHISSTTDTPCTSDPPTPPAAHA